MNFFKKANWNKQVFFYSKVRERNWHFFISEKLLLWYHSTFLLWEIEFSVIDQKLALDTSTWFDMVPKTKGNLANKIMVFYKSELYLKGFLNGNERGQASQEIAFHFKSKHFRKTWLWRKYTSFWILHHSI